MWKCPKCKREFAKTNQHHFCGKKSGIAGQGKTDSADITGVPGIDEYIAAQPEEVRGTLEKIRKTIRKAAPEAAEKISWEMPTFWQNENLVHFAVFKKHIGFFPGDLASLPFADRLADYAVTKGSIHFPLDKPVDYRLIADITKWRVSCAGHKNRGGKKPEQAGKKTKNPDCANEKIYKFRAVICSSEIGKGGAYVQFPHDIRKEFGRGRVRVQASFDGEPYEGSIVNMGIKNADGTVCYIIGVLKEIRAKIKKQPGDTVNVTVRALP